MIFKNIFFTKHLRVTASESVYGFLTPSYDHFCQLFLPSIDFQWPTFTSAEDLRATASVCDAVQNSFILLLSSTFSELPVSLIYWQNCPYLSSLKLILDTFFLQSAPIGMCIKFFRVDSFCKSVMQRWDLYWKISPVVFHLV